MEKSLSVWRDWDSKHSRFVFWLNAAELKISSASTSQPSVELVEKERDLGQFKQVLAEIRVHAGDIEDLHEVAEEVIGVCGYSAADELTELSAKYTNIQQAAKVGDYCEKVANNFF